MATMNYSHVFSSAGFSGESFDIAQGPANTGVIDVLLSVGNGALTEDAPHVLVSTGALGAARSLDLTGMEAESVGKGGQALNGRFFYLSVQNSDVSSNNLTVSGSTTINGASTFVIDTTGDYLFHHISGGVWRCNVLPTPGENLATITRINFLTTDWLNNEIKVIQSGTPVAGEVGPHGLTPYDGYVYTILNTSLNPNEYVDVEVHQDTNGDITLVKAPKAPTFNGTLIIVGSLD